MSHSVQDFPYHAGDEIPIEVTVYQKDGVTIEDISAASETRWALATEAGATPLFTKTQTGTDITQPGGGTDGIFQVAMTAADTVNLAPGLYYHEAEITLNGKKETIMTGTVDLEPSSLP